MRPRQNESVADILARSARESAARAKAVAGERLELEDLADLDARDVTLAVENGSLVYLGVGKSRRRAR